MKCHNIDQGPSMGQVSNIGQVPGISKARASVKYLVTSVKIPNIGQVSRIDLVSTAKNGFVLTKQYYQANCIPASFDWGYITNVTAFQVLQYSGYWNIIQLHGSAKEKASFVACNALFSFNGMPVGLCNATAIFQGIMARVHEGLPFVMVYLDDIVIHSHTLSEHHAHSTYCIRYSIGYNTS